MEIKNDHTAAGCCGPKLIVKFLTSKRFINLFFFFYTRRRLDGLQPLCGIGVIS
jgi:hypothetical protein